MNTHKILKYLCILFCVITFTNVYGQGTWSSVGSGINASALTMAEYKGDLYIGKLNFTSPDELDKWDGIKITKSSGTPNGPIGSLIVHDDKLYVGGGFTQIGGKAANNVATWDGITWTSLGSELDNFCINALTFYKGELYAAGYNVDATFANLAAFMIARWDGTHWVDVGDGLQGGTGAAVFSLTVYKDELYACGNFTNAGDISTPGIAKWDGTGWSAVGSTETAGDVVYIAREYQGDLYVGGAFTKIAGLPTKCIAKWDGTKWSKVSDGGGIDNTVVTLTVYNNELYIGGAFSKADEITANHIVKWNGFNWLPMGNGIGKVNDPNEQIWSITPYKDAIYVAGTLTKNGTTTIKNIAKWNPQTNGVKDILPTNNSPRIYPNPITQQNGTIKFALVSKSMVSIDLYDLAGHNLSTLFSGQLEAGTHQYSLTDAKKLTPGVYLVKVSTNNIIQTVKLVIH